MAKTYVEQKPSKTALFTALRRAIAHKIHQSPRLGPDCLAEVFLPPHFRFFLKFKRIQQNTREKLARLTPGMNEYIIARTAWLDRLFMSALDARTPQIVLLGAGYDSRAWRFARQNRSTHIFELDIAPTQERKKHCLKAAKIAVPPEVTFVPIDFNRESVVNVLEKAGWQKDQKTLVLWEGVSYYLDPGSVDATLEFFSHSSPGSSLAFDCSLSITKQNIEDYYGAKEFLEMMKQEHAGEALLFSLNEDQIEPFLVQRSLILVEHLDKAEIEKRFLAGDDGELIGQIPGYFRFVLAAPGTA